MSRARVILLYLASFFLIAIPISGYIEIKTFSNFLFAFWSLLALCFIYINLSEKSYSINVYKNFGKNLANKPDWLSYVFAILCPSLGMAELIYLVFDNAPDANRSKFYEMNVSGFGFAYGLYLLLGIIQFKKNKIN